MFHHAMKEGYLKPTPLKPYMTYADHLVWPIHVPRRCEPLITPHLSLWGNSRTRATFPTHKKSHNPHPQGESGKGVNMGTLHCGGVGGVPAKPGSYIYIYMSAFQWWSCGHLASPEFYHGTMICVFDLSNSLFFEIYSTTRVLDIWRIRDDLIYTPVN